LIESVIRGVQNSDEKSIATPFFQVFFAVCLNMMKMRSSRCRFTVALLRMKTTEIIIQTTSVSNLK
jgi:hypothetical protein